MTIAIIIGVILLGLWFIFFDTPKYLALYVWQRLGKNSYFAAQKSERKKLNRQTAKISVKWIERLDGDFSFKDRWQYDESTIKSIVEMERLEVTSKGYEEEYSKKWQEKEYLPIDCKKHNVGKTRFPYTLQINNDETLRHILAEQIDASSV